MAFAAEVDDASDLDFDGLEEARGWSDDDAIEAGWFGSKLVKKAKAAVSSVAKQIAKHDPITRTLIGVAKGQNLAKTIVATARQVGMDAKSAAPYAAMVASVVPGIGTGAAAAINAGVALASGKGLSAALLAGVKGALPGGPIAAAAFDAAMQVAKGGSLTDVALKVARDNIPGGELAKKAFDVGLAVAHGQKLQTIALEQAKSVLPGGAAGAAALELAARIGRGEPMIDAAKAVGGEAAIRAVQGVIGTQLAPALNALGSAQDVAKSLLARPELHDLPATQLAAQLGVPVQLAGEGMSLATQTVANAAKPALRFGGGGEGPSVASSSPIPVRVGDTLDALLEGHASAAAPPSFSPSPLPAHVRAGLAAYLPAQHRQRLMDAGAFRGWTHRPHLVLARPGVAVGAPRGAAHDPRPRPRFGSGDPAPRRMAHRFHPAIHRFVRQAAGLEPSGLAYKVESGDYPSKIAQQLTGSASRYPELLDANPQKATVRVYSTPAGTVNVPSSAPAASIPSGAGVTYQGRNFANLQPGEILTLPASWVKATTPAAPKPPSDNTANTLSDADLFSLKSQLLAWGQKEGGPSLSPMSPPKYDGSDLDARGWTTRDAMQLAGYQTWADSAPRNESLRLDGVLDAASYASIRAYTLRTFAATPTVPQMPPPPALPAVPAIPGVTAPPATPATPYTPPPLIPPAQPPVSAPPISVASNTPPVTQQTQAQKAASEAGFGPLLAFAAAALAFM